MPAANQFSLGTSMGRPDFHEENKLENFTNPQTFFLVSNAIVSIQYDNDNACCSI
jgi:hypothetical protein